MTHPRSLHLKLLILTAAFIAAFTAGCGALPLESWPGLTLVGDTLYAPYTAPNNRNRFQVVALDLETQSPLWAYPNEPAADIVPLAPAHITDGRIYLTSYTGKVTVLDNDGTEIWTQQLTNERLIAPATVLGNTLYIAASNGILYALDAATGDELWRFTQNNVRFWAAPLVTEDTLYLPAVNHILYALDPANGNLQWSVELAGGLVDTPALVQGKLIIGGLSNHLYALDPANGDILWDFEADGDGWIWATPLIVANTIYAGDLRGNLYAIDFATGEKQWGANYGNTGIRAAPVIYNNDTLIFGMESGELIAVEADGGAEIWRVEVDERNADRLIGPLHIYKNWVIFMPVNARITTLYAYNVANGTLTWTYPPLDN